MADLTPRRLEQSFTFSELVNIVALQGVSVEALVASTLPGHVFRGGWITNLLYPLKNVVIVNGVAYVSVVQHTSSSTFNTDLTAGKWKVLKVILKSDIAALVTGLTAIPLAAGSTPTKSEFDALATSYNTLISRLTTLGN